MKSRQEIQDVIGMLGEVIQRSEPGEQRTAAQTTREALRWILNDPSGFDKIADTFRAIQSARRT